MLLITMLLIILLHIIKSWCPYLFSLAIPVPVVSVEINTLYFKIILMFFSRSFFSSSFKVSYLYFYFSGTK